MPTDRVKAPRWKWAAAFVFLSFVEGGCASMGAADPREPGTGTTIGTDPATVKPGRTITPPSMGIDLN